MLVTLIDSKYGVSLHWFDARLQHGSSPAACN